MEPSRVVEVYCAAEDVTGTGYLTTGDTVLTAWHVVEAAGPSGAVEIRALGRDQAPGAWYRALVAWPHTGVSPGSVDAALLVVVDEDWHRPALEPVRWGRISGDRPVPVTGLGFPDAARDRTPGSRARDTLPLRGHIDPLAHAKSGDRHVVVGLDGPLIPARPGMRTSPWAGVSGTALFHGDTDIVLAVATGDHDLAVDARTLTATSAASLVAAEGFASVARAHGMRVALTPVTGKDATAQKAPETGPTVYVHTEISGSTFHRPASLGRLTVAALVVALAGGGGALWFSHSGRAQGGGPGPSYPATMSAADASSPLRLEGVTPLTNDIARTFVTPEELRLTPDQISALNAADSRDWASAHGGVVANFGSTNITLLGNDTQVVTITSMTLVKNCQAPLAGTLFLNPSGGSGTEFPLGFDLDSSITYARDVDHYQLSGDYFKEHVITLAPHEPVTLQPIVKTSTQYCRFTFRLTVATERGQVVESIDDGGKPFQLTAATPQPGIPYRAYKAAYVGGVAAHDHPGWIQVNPATYDGLGDPTFFPPTG